MAETCGVTGRDWPPAELTARETAVAILVLCRWRDEILHGITTFDHWAWLAETCDLIADFRGLR